MADGLELQRYLLNREFDFWLEEGKYRSAERLFDLDPDNPEAEKERAWEEHCLDRQNAVAWQLEELEGRGSRHPDAEIVNIEDRRKPGV
jgi:hypothetical protein